MGGGGVEEEEDDVAGAEGLRAPQTAHSSLSSGLCSVQMGQTHVLGGMADLAWGAAVSHTSQLSASMGFTRLQAAQVHVLREPSTTTSSSLSESTSITTACPARFFNGRRGVDSGDEGGGDPPPVRSIAEALGLESPGFVLQD